MDRIQLQLSQAQHIERLVVGGRESHFGPSIWSDLFDCLAEVLGGDTRLLPGRNALVVVVAVLGLMEGVGHDACDREISLVAIDCAAVSVFPEAE